MIYPQFDHVILFGGSRLLADFAKHIKDSGRYRLDVYSCERQIQEPIHADGRTLGQVLETCGIPYHSVGDINKDPGLKKLIGKKSLGIGLGEAWSFSGKLIGQFEGRLLDLMGIRLPQYRGGAHYTWQILRKNRIGCCNLQVINEQMVQGEFDSGEIVKSREYFFPASARTPEDYFVAAVKEELSFLLEFLNEARSGKQFELTRLQEQFSIYFPRLNTRKHGFIDWNWDTAEIDSFICAFDDPYIGAASFIDGRLVRLKGCFSEYGDGGFHPFQTGLIYKVDRKGAYVATRSGTIVIRRVMSDDSKEMLDSLKAGQRFFTPREALEGAMQYSISYDAKGVKRKG